MAAFHNGHAGFSPFLNKSFPAGAGGKSFPWLMGIRFAGCGAGKTPQCVTSMGYVCLSQDKKSCEACNPHLKSGYYLTHMLDFL